MASGSNKTGQINSATKKAVAATAPKSYSDPNGSFNGATGVYSPNQSPTQLATQNSLDQGVNNYANQLSNYDLNPFNSDIYKNTLAQLQAPVNRQYDQDLLSLQNNLNAKGLTGGSYDAYAHNLASQNHDYNLLQQQAPALQAYQQNFQNANTGLQGLTQARTAGLQQQYMPFNAYTAYQGAVNPLQTTAANAYGQQAQLAANRVTGFDNLMNYLKSGQQAAATAAAFM